MADLKPGYKEALRDLLQRRGRPVDIDPNARYDFDEVSSYGWVADEADVHTRQISDEVREKYHYSREDWPGCTWILDEGAEVRERTYSQFTDTDSPNANEVGVNVSPAHCACGKYTGMTLRYTASLAETLRELFGHDDKIITL